MNPAYFLKIKYLLGLVKSNEIFDWAFQQVEQGSVSNEILEIVSLKEDDRSRIIENLSIISNSQGVNKSSVIEYFYPLFIEIYNKSKEIIPIERLLLKFYSLVRNEIEFDEADNLSFSIIGNDLSLRESNLPFQLTENDIMEFLGKGRQLQ